MVIAKNNQRQITRDASFFRRVEVPEHQTMKDLHGETKKPTKDRREEAKKPTMEEATRRPQRQRKTPSHLEIYER